MQEAVEENKVLKKAIIIASSSLLETESRLKKVKEENAELKKSVPQFLHTKIDMPVLLETMQKKLAELRQAAVINKNIRINLLAQVQELREAHITKDTEHKNFKKKSVLEKKGSYSQINISKRIAVPAATPKHSRQHKSETFYFG